MEPHDLHILRRQARRDDDLGSGPVRLYSEVIDLTIMDECRANYTTLAEWLGTTPRTIRRWRDRLVEAGYLHVEEASTDRLIPTQPPENCARNRTEMSAQPDESVRSSASDRTDVSGDPDESVRSAPDESVRSKAGTSYRDNITSNARRLESGSGRASARARDDLDADGGDGADEEGAFAVDANSVNAITEAAFGEPVRGMATKDQIRTYCERAGPQGWDALRTVCETISKKGWNPSAALVKTKLRQQLDMLKESDDTGPDDFASQAQEIFDAAGRGAGAH